jgi:hypothetical protein
MATRTNRLAPLERRTSTLYLAASVLMVVFVANTALRTYQGTSFGVVQQFIAPAGFLLGLLGLIGSYRSLSTEAGRVTQVALAVAVLSALNWASIVALGVLETAGIIPENPTVQAITGVLALFSMVFAYGLFGIATARTTVYPRVVAGLLLLEALTFVAMLANSVASIGAPVIVFEVSHLVVYLGLGVTLRGTDAAAGRTDPATDPTA